VGIGKIILDSYTLDTSTYYHTYDRKFFPASDLYSTLWDMKVKEALLSLVLRPSPAPVIACSMQKWSQNGAVFAFAYCKQSKTGAREGLGMRLGVIINTNQRQRRLKNLASFPGPFRYEAIENEAAILQNNYTSIKNSLVPVPNSFPTQIHRC